ncbi:MAG: BolA family protein [Sphingopyxis sp.]
MTGPVEQAIIDRLTAALSPEKLVVSNDSAQHHGHMGDDGSGESHFSVTIISAAFAGKNRVERQRMVNHALGDLMRDNIHAMAINAQAPA